MSERFRQHVDDTLHDLSWKEEDSRLALRIMRGEEQVKRKLTWGMVLVIALIAVTMAMAVAEIVRYSVKDYQQIEDPQV